MIPCFLLLALMFLTPIVSHSQPIPKDVKSIVAFILTSDDSANLRPNGTGFFVGVEDTSKGEVYAVYLVTAKHVLRLPDNSDYYRTVFIRLNRKSGDAQAIRLDLFPSGTSKNVFIHSDPSVDIAVVSALPDENTFDFKFLPDSYITTEGDFANLKITEGSEIFFTGLFTPHIGEHRNYPVVRFGRVALVTDERIDWDGVKTRLYLVESTSYGGNSGSPVFFYLGADREPGSIILGSPVLKLAGIMKGFFGERHPIEIVDTRPIPFSVANMGIAAVVPAYQLHQILFSDEAKNKRGF